MTVTIARPGDPEPGTPEQIPGQLRRGGAPPGRLVQEAGRAVAPIGVVLLVFLTSLGVRLIGLDLYSTTDEGYWIQRSIRFGAALAREDLASTFRAGHPGVTVMWTGLLGIGPDRLAPYLPEQFTRFELLERDPGYLHALSAARRTVAVVAAGLVTLTVVLAWRLFGLGPALASGALLVFDPYVIGMTRLLHVDALLAPLMTVSVLAGLSYWLRASRWPLLLLSAVAGGLALLTKAPAGMVPIFFGLVFLAGIAPVWRGGWRRWQRDLAPFLLWGVVAAAVYLLLFPALWVDPIGRFQSLIAFVSATGLQPHNGNFFLGQPILDDPGLFYYVVALPLRMSPLVAVGLALLALPAAKTEQRVAVRWLVVYALLFAGLMTLASKKFDRYMLPTLMVCDLLAGIGLWRLAVLAAGKSSALRIQSSGGGTSALPIILVTLIAAVQLTLLARVWPYPIAYYNPLAGGPERARELIMVGWGEGLEQVAAYLNGLPDAEDLYVVTSYNHVVRPRFVGTTIPISPYLFEPRDPSLPTPDYVVLYVNAIQRRQIPTEVQQAQAEGPPVFVAHVNGQEYAWVYQIPRSGPRPTGPAPTETDADAEEN